MINRIIIGIIAVLVLFFITLFHEDILWNQLNVQQTDRLVINVEIAQRRRMFFRREPSGDRYSRKVKNVTVPYPKRQNGNADIPLSQLIKMRNGRRANESKPGIPAPKLPAGLRKAIPSSFDWTQKDVLSPIKSQGLCGSCYTFSVAAYLESQLAIKYPKSSKYNFSSQQSLDCSTSYGNYGCSGGLEVNVFQYVANKGLQPMETYPYIGRLSECRQNAQLFKVGVTKIYHYRDVTVDFLKNLLVTRGPVCAGMDASLEDFNGHKGGIYSNPKCAKRIDQLNHAVLVVGYGTEKGEDYWIVRNSWGLQWGERGYFRIKQKDNTCGITTDISFADIKPIN